MIDLLNESAEIKQLRENLSLWQQRYGLLWTSIDAGLNIGKREKVLYRKWMDEVPEIKQ